MESKYLSFFLPLLIGVVMFTGLVADLSSTDIPADLTARVGKYFSGTTGALVIYDLKADTYGRYNAVRCAQQFSPKSTFKIPNSLFALETGVLANVDTIIPWDQKRDPKQEWWDSFGWSKDHTMRSAIQYSVVWFYQEVARRIGVERMKKWVDTIGYGNRDISGPIDQFWLNDTIQISADEQIQFLKKFYLGELGFSAPVTVAVKEILVREQGDGYILSAKTGGGDLKKGPAAGRFVGWYVGYIEKGDQVYFFALNIDGPTFADIKDKRVEIVHQVFKELGVIKE
jgi:beta-lactamase class D